MIGDLIMIKDLVLLETLIDGDFEISMLRAIAESEETGEYSDTFVRIMRNGHFECYQYAGVDFITLKSVLDYIVEKHI